MQSVRFSDNIIQVPRSCQIRRLVVKVLSQPDNRQGPGLESRLPTPESSTQQSRRLLQPFFFGQLNSVFPNVVDLVNSSPSVVICHLLYFYPALLLAMSVAAVMRRGPTRSCFPSSPACTRISALHRAQSIPRWVRSYFICSQGSMRHENE